MATPEESASLLSKPRRERADATRNRIAILAATNALIEEGIDHVTMQAVADKASVGVGTLYRRFGDRRGLLLAVLSEAEEKFQTKFLQGPAPLGPGEDGAAGYGPQSRIEAFMHALLDHTIVDLDLRIAVDKAAGRTADPYLTWRHHVLVLVQELGEEIAPTPDYWADYLLAGLSPGLVRDQLARGETSQDLHGGLQSVLNRLLKQT